MKKIIILSFITTTLLFSATRPPEEVKKQFTKTEKQQHENFNNERMNQEEDKFNRFNELKKETDEVVEKSKYEIEELKNQIEFVSQQIIEKINMGIEGDIKNMKKEIYQIKKQIKKEVFDKAIEKAKTFFERNGVVEAKDMFKEISKITIEEKGKNKAEKENIDFKFVSGKDIEKHTNDNEIKKINAKNSKEEELIKKFQLILDLDKRQKQYINEKIEIEQKKCKAQTEKITTKAKNKLLEKKLEISKLKDKIKELEEKIKFLQKTSEDNKTETINTDDLILKRTMKIGKTMYGILYNEKTHETLKLKKGESINTDMLVLKITKDKVLIKTEKKVIPIYKVKIKKEEPKKPVIQKKEGELSKETKEMINEVKPNKKGKGKPDDNEKQMGKPKEIKGK